MTVLFSEKCLELKKRLQIPFSAFVRLAITDLFNGIGM